MALAANHLLSSMHTSIPIASRPVSMLRIKHVLRFLQDSSLEAINVLWIRKKKQQTFFGLSWSSDSGHSADVRWCAVPAAHHAGGGDEAGRHQWSHLPALHVPARGCRTSPEAHADTLGCGGQRMVSSHLLLQRWQPVAEQRGSQKGQWHLTRYQGNPWDTVNQSLDYQTSCSLIC